MEKIDVHLKKYEIKPAKSVAQERVWERADACIEVCKWLYLSEVIHTTHHLEPSKIIYLMEYAKKNGEKPKSFFRYLVNNERVVDTKEK